MLMKSLKFLQIIFLQIPEFPPKYNTYNEINSDWSSISGGSFASN